MGERSAQRPLAIGGRIVALEPEQRQVTLGSLRMLKAGIPRLRGHGGRLILITSLWGQP